MRNSRRLVQLDRDRGLHHGEDQTEKAGSILGCGLLFGAGVLSVSISNAINSRLVIHVSRQKLIGLGALLAAIAGSTVALAGLLGVGGLPSSPDR